MGTERRRSFKGPVEDMIVSSLKSQRKKGHSWKFIKKWCHKENPGLREREIKHFISLAKKK